MECSLPSVNHHSYEKGFPYRLAHPHNLPIARERPLPSRGCSKASFLRIKLSGNKSQATVHEIRGPLCSCPNHSGWERCTEDFLQIVTIPSDQPSDLQNLGILVERAIAFHFLTYPDSVISLRYILEQSERSHNPRYTRNCLPFLIW